MDTRASDTVSGARLAGPLSLGAPGTARSRAATIDLENALAISRLCQLFDGAAQHQILQRVIQRRPGRPDCRKESVRRRGELPQTHRWPKIQTALAGS
jgi:hypothetical protein